jgi:pimeloyl-ACP methyl ester carboxylesterase
LTAANASGRVVGSSPAWGAFSRPPQNRLLRPHDPWLIVLGSFFPARYHRPRRAVSILLSKAHIVLLPGLDGTCKLFAPLIAHIPAGVPVTSVALPTRPVSYERLIQSVELPESERLVLVAESFSGPLAVGLAQRHRVAAIVFCNSFVSSPRSSALGLFVTPFIFRVRVPQILLRHFLVGKTASADLVQLVADTIETVPRKVLEERLRCVFNVDVSIPFSRLDVPILYLRSTEDRLVPDSSCQHMAALRRVSVARLSGPHLLLQTHPMDAWNSIAHFLASIPEPQSSASTWH